MIRLPQMTQPLEDKITIIEGPPPEFEPIEDAWAMGLNEAAGHFNLAITRLRTFNGQALVERCHHAWRLQAPMYLHYRNVLGMEDKVPIMAARSVDSDDGQVLFLWVRQKTSNSEE